MYCAQYFGKNKGMSMIQNVILQGICFPAKEYKLSGFLIRGLLNYKIIWKKSEKNYDSLTVILQIFASRSFAIPLHELHR